MTFKRQSVTPREKAKTELAAVLSKYHSPERIDALLESMERKRWLSEEKTGRVKRIELEIPEISRDIMKNISAIIWMSHEVFEQKIATYKKMVERTRANVLELSTVGIDIPFPDSLLSMERLEENIAKIKERFPSKWAKILKKASEKHGAGLSMKTPNYFREICESANRMENNKNSKNREIRDLRKMLSESIPWADPQELEKYIQEYIVTGEVSVGRIEERIGQLDENGLLPYLEGRISRLFVRDKEFEACTAFMKKEKFQDEQEEKLKHRLAQQVGQKQAERTISAIMRNNLSFSRAMERIDNLELEFGAEETGRMLVRGTNCLIMSSRLNSEWLDGQRIRISVERERGEQEEKLFKEMELVLGERTKDLLGRRTISIDNVMKRVKAAKEALGDRWYGIMLAKTSTEFVCAAQKKFEKSLAYYESERKSAGEIAAIVPKIAMPALEHRIESKRIAYSTTLEKLRFLTRYKGATPIAATYAKSDFRDYVENLRERNISERIKNNAIKLLFRLLPKDIATMRSRSVKRRHETGKLQRRMEEVIHDKGILCLEYAVNSKWLKLISPEDVWNTAKKEIYEGYSLIRDNEPSEFQVKGAYGMTLPFRYGIEKYFEAEIRERIDHSVFVRVTISENTPFEISGGEAGKIIKTLGAINSGDEQKILNETSEIVEEISAILQRLDKWYLGDNSDIMLRLVILKCLILKSDSKLGGKVSTKVENKSSLSNYIMDNYAEFGSRNYELPNNEKLEESVKEIDLSAESGN